jgi:predicted RNA-binding protein YlxR (DUF448 family)
LVLVEDRDMDDRDDAPAGAERTCAVTRATLPPEQMIRFVLGPDDAVVPDIKRKLPGRGVWVGLSKDLVAQAVKKQVFSRGLKAKALAAPDLPELIDRLLARDALQALSIANKAGLVTTGFAKVETAIATGVASALVHARDGASDGKRKLGQALRRKYGPEGRTEIGIFSGEELDAALGRGNVTHAALASGPAAKVFLASSRRLAVYRGGEDVELTKDTALESDSEAEGTNGQGPGTHERHE